MVHYRVSHATHYSYGKAVCLMPHILRLRPRCDGHQSLLKFQIEIDPAPSGCSEITDLQGNAITKIWFNDQELHQLWIKTSFEVETHCANPFNYLLEPWAVQFPIDYPHAIALHIHPYLQGQWVPGIDPAVIELAQEVCYAADGQIVPFLSLLNQRIYETCTYQIRETGAAHPAGITWRHQKGSCRDLAVLFIEACRAVGLAARFVSGYQEGDVDQDDRDLHAWAEVYLPGAGWRGFDPTHGLAVSDRHIPLVASARSQEAAPISGTLHPGSQTQSSLTTQISIDKVIA